MTEFVRSFSTQQLLPPWISKGAKTWMYFINVDRGCIQKYLDDYLNICTLNRSPYRYEAMEGKTFGILQVGQHPHFSSGRKDQKGWDTLHHTEVSWIFPVMRTRISPDKHTVECQAVWIMPFAFDDTSYIMFSSREIWGTRVNHASIHIKEDKSHRLRHLDVAMNGVQKFSPRSKNHLIGCIHVAMSKAKKSGNLKDLLQDYPELVQFTDVVAASAALKGQADTAHVNEVNTLKQFRDAFDMNFAVYRAIIASQTIHTHVKKLHFYHGSTVEIDFMWSDSTAQILTDLFGLKKPTDKSIIGHPTDGPIIDEKGIDWDMPRIRVPVEMALSFTSNIRYEVCKTLHTYGA